jgi:hypothetical protein
MSDRQLIGCPPPSLNSPIPIHSPVQRTIHDIDPDIVYNGDYSYNWGLRRVTAIDCRTIGNLSMKEHGGSTQIENRQWC